MMVLDKIASVSIDINITGGDWPDEDELQKLAQTCIFATIKTANLHLPENAQLSLLFSDDQTLSRLNQQFRAIAEPTNVLSFPWDGSATDNSHLGDIAFACETITREAAMDGKTFEHHLCHLVIHGFLHLFGYDHQNDIDAGKMENLEIETLGNLAVQNPYDAPRRSAK